MSYSTPVTSSVKGDSHDTTTSDILASTLRSITASGGPIIITSGKIIQLNEYGCRDAPCEKSWKQGYPLSNTIKDTSTIMRNPLPELCREGLRMIVLVSLIVLLRGYPCFHDFSHGASLHPYSFN